MEREIIIDAGIWETRAALLEDGELAELLIERPYPESMAGNIYRGKVMNILPGMQAAFVDIGSEKNAFLYADDVIDTRLKPNGSEGSDNTKIKTGIENLLKAGQEITVQVVKEPMGTKGARVTMNITLPGRYIVLLPNSEYKGVSRKIEDGQERARLGSILDRIKPPGMGIIMRTNSEGKREEDFKKEVDFLYKLWENIKSREKKGSVPRILHKDFGLVFRMMRDLLTEDVKRFVINNEEVYNEALKFAEMFPAPIKFKVQQYNKEYDIFEFYNIESSIARALSRKIWLKSGGYIVFDHTEALTVIDVNTGKFTGKQNLEDTVVRTNMEAAVEIARQLRLRDIGGIIIIDFIDMRNPENKNMVMNKLKEALKLDRTKTTVVGITGLGLVEMTRKKVHEGLESVMKVPCYKCRGTGKAESPWISVGKLEKTLLERLRKKGCCEYEVTVHPELNNILKQDNSAMLKKLEATYNIKVKIIEDENIRQGNFSIINCDNVKVD